MKKTTNKYSHENIIAYVSGLNIEGFDIEELEEDPLFMTKVIEFTKDKNTYDYCSKEMKSTFDFTKSMLNIFKDDPKFCIKIANNFLNKNEESDEKIFEIYVMMRNITKCLDDEDSDVFAIGANVYFESDKIHIEYQKQNDKIFEDEIGLGFKIYSLAYKSKTILDYVAERYLEIIYYDYNLEKMFHDRFKSFDDIEKFGKYKVLAMFVELYDNALANYILKNKDSIKIIDKFLNKIKSEWKYYNNQNFENEEELYEEIISDVADYLNEHDCRFDLDSALDYVSREFHVEEKIKKYNYSDMIEQMMIFNSPLYDVDSISDQEFEEYLKKEAEEKTYSNDLYEELCTISDKNIQMDDLPYIIEIRKIFAKHLGVTLNESEQKVSNNGNKVLYFNKKKKKKDEEK